MRIIPVITNSRLLPIALGQAIGLGCGVIGVKLMSHLVDPADYGRYGLFLTATPLGMWVVHAGLIKFTGRHWGESNARAQLLQEMGPSFVRKLPWLALAAAGTAWFIEPSHWLAVFITLLFGATLLSVVAIAQAALQSARENWHDFGVIGTTALTRTFLPPLFYVVAGGTTLSLYGGYCVHTLLAAAVSALTLRCYWKAPVPAAAPQLTAVYDGPLFVGLAVSTWVMAGLNRWIVAVFFGATTAGHFVLAGNIAMIATAMLGAIFQQYFQPVIFAAPSATDPERRMLARHVDFVALGYCALALCGLALLQYVAPWLVGNLINENYRPAIPYIMPAGCFLTTLVTGSFFHSLLLAGRRETACAPVDFSSAGLLALGCLVAAAVGGEIWLQRWLLASPLVPWLLNRPLARYFLLRPDRIAP